MDYCKSLIIVVSCTSAVGCVSNNVEESYHAVAKSWNQMVRASQVIPVYPLQEDLRPGDAFITPFTTNTEIESWKEEGYLRLDNVYARLKPNDNIIEDLPKAAFPTYSFTIDSRSGGGLALPVSSVPVALALSGAKSATGTISFKDAFSNGMTDREANALVNNWATEDILSELKDYTKNENHRLYVLRVVTRTFSVKTVSVGLTFTDTSGVNLQAGAPPSTPELWGASPADYDKMIAYLNKQIALKTETGDAPELPADTDTQDESSGRTLSQLQKDLEIIENLRSESIIDQMKRQLEKSDQIDKYGGFFLPGASYKFSSFSQYGAGMEEKFDAPLVFGYWATEYIINTDGPLIPLRRSRGIIENPELLETLIKNIEEERKNNRLKGPLPKKNDNNRSEV